MENTSPRYSTRSKMSHASPVRITSPALRSDNMSKVVLARYERVCNLPHGISEIHNSFDVLKEEERLDTVRA